MHSFSYNSAKEFTLGEYITLTPHEESVKSLTPTGDNSVVPLAAGINILMNPNPRANAAAALYMAISQVLTEPERLVVYVNTYAGVTLMKESAKVILQQLGIAADDPRLGALRILESPIDCWNMLTLYHAVREGDEMADRPVVIINAFEYCAINRPKRSRIVGELLKFVEALSATVILFSHEVRKDLKAGFPGRGALGIAAVFATSIFETEDPEIGLEFIRQTGEMHANWTQGVHENETHASQQNNSAFQIVDWRAMVGWPSEAEADASIDATETGIDWSNPPLPPMSERVWAVPAVWRGAVGVSL